VTRAISSADNILANLPGDLLGHRLAHLPWDVPAGLSGDLDGNLTGDLVALLPGHITALLPWDSGALLPWDGLALLPWHSVALLLGDIVADGLGDGPGGVDALGLGNWEAPLLGDKAGLLDWPVVADAPDLGLAPWGSAGNGSDSASDESGISFRLSLSLTLAQTKGPHATKSSKSSVTRGSNGSSSSNSSTTNGSTNNRLDCNLALNSNQSSLGTVLSLDVLALFNNGGVNNRDRLGDTLLASVCGTLLVGDLLDNVAANFLRDGVADLVGHCVANLVGHSVANLLIHCVANFVGNGVADVVVLSLVLGLSNSVALAVPDSSALLGGGHVVDCPADRLGDCDGGRGNCYGGNPHSWGNCHSWGSPGNGWGTQIESCVAPGSCAMASISIATPAGSIVAAVETSCSISLWLAQSQGCSEGENSQKRVHFVCRT